MAVIRRCAVCGNFFNAFLGKQKYCAVCAPGVTYYTNTPIVNKECPTCHSMFSTNKSAQVYCNARCKKLFHKRGGIVWELVHCPMCEREFRRTDKRNHYCSTACRIAAKKQRDEGRPR